MTVYLVGAGPGDPGLLTRRGAELLARADVVVHDRLVRPELLALAPPTARRIDVGKRPGMPERQADIEALLVTEGRRAAVVVRLKGGDPYLFGRGGEEAEALRRAGVAVEVVPGVSSALAAPAAAGVPVTHRGLSTSVTVVTGHLGDPSAPGGVDWESLGRAGGTLVVLMGMANRAGIARALLRSGRAPDTPVLVVRWGTTAEQQNVRTTLDALPDVALEAPATIVIGAVAGLDLGGVEARPLHGLRVVVTRAADRADDLTTALEVAGAAVVRFPVLTEADPLDGGKALRRAVAGVRECSWVVFTSAAAVARVGAVLRDGRDLAGVRLAAVGEATADALRRLHLEPDLVPPVATAEALVEAFAPAEPGAAPVLFPKAAGARDVVPRGLEAKGYRVREVVAYTTVTGEPPGGWPPGTQEAAESADVVTFASPSAVRGFLDVTAGRPGPPVVACIGPVTAARARRLGLDVQVEAADHSAAGLVEALVAWARGRGPEPGRR